MSGNRSALIARALSCAFASLARWRRRNGIGEDRPKRLHRDHDPRGDRHIERGGRHCKRPCDRLLGSIAYGDGPASIRDRKHFFNVGPKNYGQHRLKTNGLPKTIGAPTPCQVKHFFPTRAAFLFIPIASARPHALKHATVAVKKNFFFICGIHGNIRTTVS
jgi:hypothetical protein